MLPITALLAITLAFSSLPAQVQGAQLRSLTPLERLTSERLQATHQAVRDFAQQRRVLPARPGLKDYRCIFHAHAEDSSHTGGTLPEMLADAKKAGVHAIFLGNHFRPPRDFMENWRGMKEGVLFVPGSEVRGFLVHPEGSIMPRMEAPLDEFIRAVTVGEGLIFLSHVEERADHAMDGLHGLEIYNRHYDAKRDMPTLIALAMRMIEPKQLAELQEWVRLYPDEVLAAQVLRQDVYLHKWDSELAKGRRLTGVAANDCHHNQVLVVKVASETQARIGTSVDREDQMRLVDATARPGLLEMMRGRQPGEIIARVDLDPYERSFRNVATHVLAAELTEPALRAALKAGRAYVSHDWLCDATGFAFNAGNAGMGDEIQAATGVTLRASAPLPCRWALFRNGELIKSSEGADLVYETDQPGAYRVEAALECAGDLRPWIYSNPIYLR